ncbi:hypothetical protein SAMN05216256_101268 [Halopseudomonas pachastrellae]|jgi:hypothetical protein|nr:hypothetical protein SAMN05216256_101268 [Halopseudomonas pachastrellae]
MDGILAQAATHRVTLRLLHTGGLVNVEGLVGLQYLQSSVLCPPP